MRIFSIQNVFFALIVVAVMGVGQLTAQEIPLQGAFSGAGNDFSGAAFPIGRFAGVFDPATGTAEWTARRGTLSNQTIRFDLIQEVYPNVFYYEQSVIFTGGTGRFANVTGTAEFIGLINLESGAYFGLIDGELTRN